jgi:hypothetical protein
LGHQLDGAFERVNRAEEHFFELQRHLNALRQSYLDAARIHFDPNPPYRAYAYPPINIVHPPIISIVLGEICYNLRSALDYLVYELARFDSNAIQDGTQFPIDDTRSKFVGHKHPMLKGISIAHEAKIEKFQPYNGCIWTKTLRTLSNPDKHRTLTPRGSVFTVDVLDGGKSIEIGHGRRLVRHAKRPDGRDVQVELVGSFEIIVTVNVHPTMGDIGDSVEVTAENLILNVRDLLETFKPEFK